MTQAYNFGALLEEAQKEGIGGSLLPNGNYTLFAKIAKVSASSGGKDQIGVMWQVVDGPLAGQTTWENQTLSPENPKAMAAFFGWCKKFGMDNAFFQRQPQPTLAEIANVINGMTIAAEVGSRKWGKNMDKEDNTVKVKAILSTAGGAVAATVPTSPAVVPAAALPAPVAVVPAPEPTAAPVAAVDPTQDPAYQAFLAAQANAAAAPAVAPLPAAPAAVTVPQPVAAIDPATGLPARSF